MILSNHMLFWLRCLGFECILVAFTLIAYALSCKLSPVTSLLTRFCSVIVCGMWLSAVAFHLLTGVGAYHVLVAIPLLVAAFVMGKRVRFFGRLRKRELTYYANLMGWRLNYFGKRRVHLLQGAFVLVAVLHILHAFIMLPLGWDTLTYHGVKAAGWVSRQGRFELNGPGGWSLFSLHPGTWEAWLSWFMLPFRSDIVACLADTLCWVLLFPAMLFLGNVMSVREPFRTLSAVFVVSTPLFRLLLGSGYSEPALCLTIVLAAAFSIRYFRTLEPGSLVCALAAAGLAAGTKLWAQPMAFVFALAVLMRWLLKPKTHVAWRWTLAGVLMAAVVVIPWLYNNWRHTGAILSPADIKLGGLVFGRSIPTVDWLIQQPVRPYEWIQEKAFIERVFSIPGRRDGSLGIFAAVPWAVALVMLIRQVREHPYTSVTLLAVMLVTLVNFYSPKLSMIRLVWGNERFLLPLVCLLTPASVAGIPRVSKLTPVYTAFLSIVSIYQLFYYMTPWWTRYDAKGVLGGGLLVSLSIFVLVAIASKRRRIALMLAALILFPGLVFAAKHYRDQHRQALLERAVTFHDIPRSWVQPALMLDQPPTRYNIAVTSGPLQSVDSWFTYYFFGRELQNQVSYVPVTVTGKVVDFWPPGKLEQQASYVHWRARLLRQGITHVMSFFPYSLEQRWMDEHPTLFERVAGKPAEWGLYRVR